MQLRQEVAKLTERQQICESEVQRCRNEMQRADSGRRAQEQETGLSDQRRGHIEAEYEMYLRKEQLRIDFVNESQEMHRNAMDELQKAIAEGDQARQRTQLEKETIEQEIDRCNEAINKFQVHSKHCEGLRQHVLLLSICHCLPRACFAAKFVLLRLTVYASRAALGMCDRAWAGTGKGATAARRRVPRQALRYAREVHRASDHAGLPSNRPCMPVSRPRKIHCVAG